MATDSAAAGSDSLPQDVGGVAATVDEVLPPNGWKTALPGPDDAALGDVVAASGDGTFTRGGGTGVLARLLSVDPLLPPSSRIRFRRFTSGALDTSWSRKPARCTLWNALSVAVICFWTLPCIRLRTLGVASGVVDSTSRFVPLIHSFLRRSDIDRRSFGLTVKRPCKAANETEFMEVILWTD